MGWVVMSEPELNRVEALAQVDDGRLSVDNAASMLAATLRQIFPTVKAVWARRRVGIRHASNLRKTASITPSAIMRYR